MDRTSGDETLNGLDGLEEEFKAQLNLNCKETKECEDESTHQSSTNEVVEGENEILWDFGDFPVAVKKDKVLGRYLVAKRDIPQGQIVLKDKPIFTSPNPSTGVEPTCLGCCVEVTSPVPCSKCGWPVCGIECEKIPEHAEYECEVFARENVKPQLDPPLCFIASEEYIKVLRGVLLSEKETPEAKLKWKSFQMLESHVEFRKSIPKVHFMSSLSKKFVLETCNLKQFSEELIDFVLGVIDVNAFRHTIHPNNPLRAKVESNEKAIDRNATFIYPRGAMAAHGCRRNVRWETLPNGDLEMWSAEVTKAGNLLTHPYVDLMLGTPDRRRQLKDQFYFDCSCDRCADPTEFGTFFSALKCPECKSGYLLPVDPLDYETSWKCNNIGSSGNSSQDDETASLPASVSACGCTKSSQFERDLVSQIQSEKKTVLEMLEFGSNLAVIGGLARILGKYRAKKVHVNHFTIVDIEYNLVKRMARIPKPTMDVIHELKRLIHKFLDISEVFYPGAK